MQVELTNITKEFFSLRGRVTALKDVSLKINDREFFVLLGPSGCGKSTLLNLIAGLEQPVCGQIKFNDKVVADSSHKIFLSPKERNIAFVFQSYALYPHLDVFENIAFPLRIAHENNLEIKRAVEKAAMTMNISDLLAAKPRELSGGQRQRVAIARAIVRKPDVFLLDEPLSNLDAQLRTAMRVEIRNLQNRLGITTIYVTHDQVEAMSLGDRIAVLNHGQIEQIGTPSTLYEKPASIFVAQFIGSPPMNFIKSHISDIDGKLHLILGNQKLEIPTEKVRDFCEIKTKCFTLGIRPEHVNIEPPSDIQTIKAKVQSIEPLGREMVVYLSINDCVITALSDKKELKKDQEVRVGLQCNKAHIFNST